MEDVPSNAVIVERISNLKTFFEEKIHEVNRNINTTSEDLKRDVNIVSDKQTYANGRVGKLEEREILAQKEKAVMEAQVKMIKWGVGGLLTMVATIFVGIVTAYLVKKYVG